MATIIAVPEKTQNKTAMKRVLDYVMQDYKTVYGDKKFVSGQNCIPESAYLEFMATKNQYRKANGVFFKQYVQSFKPNTATPELIHQIGIETAKFFDGFEVVIATHIDKDHWHNHFVVNSVNCEMGLKIQINEKGLENLRNYSDEICLKYGLETLKPYTKPKQKSPSQREYRAAMKGDSWKFALMAMIDRAMKHCRTIDEFRKYLKRYGYDVKWQDSYKYITYTCPNNMKCRDIRLHQEKYRKEKMELEFRLREAETEKRREYQQAAASDEYNGDRPRTMADADRTEQESSNPTGGYSSNKHSRELFRENGQADNKRDGLPNEFDENGIHRYSETGWEAERECLFSNGSNEQYDESTEEEMDTVTDWNTDSDTNCIMDGIYTLANVAETIERSTNQTPRSIRNKKKGLGQRDDDHSGDYQNNNELYYGPSM